MLELMLELEAILTGAAGHVYTYPVYMYLYAVGYSVVGGSYMKPEKKWITLLAFSLPNKAIRARGC